VLFGGVTLKEGVIWCRDLIREGVIWWSDLIREGVIWWSDLIREGVIWWSDLTILSYNITPPTNPLF
jgi:hypothetical protein